MAQEKSAFTTITVTRSRPRWEHLYRGQQPTPHIRALGLLLFFSYPSPSLSPSPEAWLLNAPSTPLWTLTFWAYIATTTMSTKPPPFHPSPPAGRQTHQVLPRLPAKAHTSPHLPHPPPARGESRGTLPFCVPIQLYDQAKSSPLSVPSPIKGRK